MANTPSTCSAVARRPQIRTARVIFAGAQTAPSAGGGGHVVSVDDNNNPSSGDIFTQNAQDQSTA
jgi:hypothetical protein